jgi:hypothetical protein
VKDLIERLEAIPSKVENEKFYDQENAHEEADEILLEALDRLEDTIGVARAWRQLRESVGFWYA